MPGNITDLDQTRTRANGQAGIPRRFSPDCSRTMAPGERPRWGIGGEWCLVPAITPWVARGVIGQWWGRVSIGEILTSARRQAGLTITQVSERTRIRETIIRGIERDDFPACGGDFYARGHIRAIARTAGVDLESLIREYDSSQGTPQASTVGVPGPPAALRLPGAQAELERCIAVSARGSHRPGRLSPGGISARWQRNGCGPQTRHRASGRPQAPAAKSAPAPAAASPSRPLADVLHVDHW